MGRGRGLHGHHHHSSPNTTGALYHCYADVCWRLWASMSTQRCLAFLCRTAVYVLEKTMCHHSTAHGSSGIHYWINGVPKCILPRTKLKTPEEGDLFARKLSSGV